VALCKIKFAKSGNWQHTKGSAYTTLIGYGRQSHGTEAWNLNEELSDNVEALECIATDKQLQRSCNEW